VGASAGSLDENRNLIGEFINDGWYYAADAAGLNAMPAATTKLLGLFAFSNMNVAKDKIDKRRNDPAAMNGEGGNFIVDDFGFPDQPMLDEMTTRALDVLSRNRNGFVLMVEARLNRQTGAQHGYRTLDSRYHRVRPRDRCLPSVRLEEPRHPGLCHRGSRMRRRQHNRRLPRH
jgi:hypothetical protein